MSKLRAAWEKVADLPVIRTIANRDLRYINFSGEPLYGSFGKAFLRSAEFKTGVVCLAATVPYCISQDAYTAASLYAFCNIGGTVGTNLVNQLPKRELRMLWENFCIDKKGYLRKVTGDEQQAEHIVAVFMNANRTQVIKMAGVVAVLGQVNHSIGNTFGGFHDLFDIRLGALLIGAPIIMSALSSYNRFKDVQDGKWAIVKTPPKEEVRQEDKVTALNAVPELT